MKISHQRNKSVKCQHCNKSWLTIRQCNGHIARCQAKNTDTDKVGEGDTEKGGEGDAEKGEEDAEKTGEVATESSLPRKRLKSTASAFTLYNILV